MRTNRGMSGSSSTMRTVGIDVERRPRRPSRSGSGRPWASAHELLGEADPGDPLLRLTDLGQAGQPAGAAPHRLERVGATAEALDLGDEPLAVRVLVQLGLEADEALDDLGDRLGAGPPLAQHARSEEHTSELQSLMRISYA